MKYEKIKLMCFAGIFTAIVFASISLSILQCALADWADCIDRKEKSACHERGNERFAERELAPILAYGREDVAGSAAGVHGL